MSTINRILNSRVMGELRQRTAVRLLRRIHRITHRLPVELQTVDKARVLVVAPHMDDEVIGPGGTLALHRRVGSPIDVVFCARGADEEADRTRKAEAAACAEFMGFSQRIHLDFPEGALSRHEPDLSRRLGEVVEQVDPEVVFAPFVSDHHRDHSACTMALCEALTRVGYRGRIWAYEVWSPLWPNVCVDISEVEQTKREAIAFHVSQTAGVHYIDGALGLNRYRGLRVYVDYAEAFFVTSAKELAEVGRAMNSL